MKKIIRRFLYNLLSFWILAFSISAFSYSHDHNLIWAALIFTLLSLVIQPVINILFLPISLISFGLLSWFPSMLILYFTTLVASDWKINSAVIPSLSIFNFSTPAVHFGWLTSLIFVSISHSLLKKILKKIM